MKQNFKITLCATMASLSVVFMLLSYFPYLTYAVPAVSGLFIMITVIEINCKWSLCTYIAASVLIFIFAEPESKLMYICLFGYYPILKSVIERIRLPLLEWILKIIVFNLSVLLIYSLLSKIFDISVDDFKTLGKYGVYVFLAAGNVAFVLYDIAVSRMAVLYMNMLHSKISKILKK